jgi:hypothetical protein
MNKKIITKLSTRDIWKCLKENKSLDEFIENVPNEFEVWVKEQAKMFREKFLMLDIQCETKYYKEIKPLENTSRKKVTTKILTYDKSLQPIFFHMYDGKDYSHLIWNKLYPSYNKIFNGNNVEGDKQ